MPMTTTMMTMMMQSSILATPEIPMLVERRAALQFRIPQDVPNLRSYSTVF